ncbi:MAG: peptidase [Armatimonadetes bacterium]|nr:peptidase [Armatimonadota bacterium]
MPTSTRKGKPATAATTPTRPHFCTDRLPAHELARPQLTIGRGGGARAIIVISKMWPNGSTLRVRFMGGTAAQKNLARQQALWWTEHANLKFDFNDAPDAEIRVAFNPNDGAWSFIGTDCKGIPLNQPTMNLGFMDGGTAAHEFGHAIGLGHEHQNPRGGIQWNEARVIQDLSGSPNFWDEATIRHNVINKYSTNQIRGTEFDDNSIMLYFFPASWTQGGMATHANEVLSELDKSFIASSQAYPKTDVGGAPAPVVLKTDGTPKSASIGKTGEEDLFSFKVTKAGRYVVETGGTTDLVMKLYGPNNPTALIAEDDDSGVALNARIIATLLPGTYLVQIRHYNLNNGTGNYTVRVRKG